MHVHSKRGTARTALLAAVLALLALATPPAPATGEPDIADRLRAVPGLTVLSEQPVPGTAYRMFRLSFRQRVDHRDPSAGTFEQRIQLLHIATDRPTVLHTTGYQVPADATRTEPTKLLDANQISFEYRFFGTSRPEPAEWSTLDIWQAASDEHAIAKALRPVYRAKWVSTGNGKGGMAAVYHRRFYPHDVSGVIAYVASHNAVDTEDSAYDRFFQTVGTNPECRTALADVQREALLRRDELGQRFRALADRKNLTFTRTHGTVDRALEAVVLDTPWAFWQFFTQADCARVPTMPMTTDALFSFIDETAGFETYTDQGLLPSAPFYYQAATQTGWPSLSFPHLEGLRRYPGLYEANPNLPRALRRPHDPRPMLDVGRWVRHSSRNMMFLYGTNDPWSAERFVPSDDDSYLYTVEGAGHTADIASLPPRARTTATSAVLRWAGTHDEPGNP